MIPPPRPPKGHSAVVARRYRCMRCKRAKKGKTSRYFSALHEDVIKQLGADIQHALPFRVFKRKLVHMSVLHMTTSLRLSGTSFEAISRAIRWSLTTQHLRQWLSYNCSLLWLRQQGAVLQGKIRDAFQSFGEYCAPVISARMLKTLFSDDHDRRKKDTLAFLATVYSDVLMWDHTFWSTKHIREAGSGSSQLFKAQFGVGGGDGSILGLSFTRTKSLEEPATKMIFDSILERADKFGHTRPRVSGVV